MIESMVVPIDACVTFEHLPLIQDALRLTGIPGTLEFQGKQLEIIPPAYADPAAIEILRPVIENVLLRVATQIKQESLNKRAFD